MKHQGYFNRALKATDQRYARVFGKMGYARSDMVADDQTVSEERQISNGEADPRD
jgi:hypothetical protein